MVDEPRFIIGRGERLTEPVTKKSGGKAPVLPYDRLTARTRMADRVQSAVGLAVDLPVAACPRDEVVAMLTLHPAFLAKSYYPDQLLRDVGLDPVGSRPTTILPEQVGKRQKDKESGEETAERVAGSADRPSTQLFVATTRTNLTAWRDHLAGADELTDAEEDLAKIEHFSLQTRWDRIRIADRDSSQNEVAIEAVLHSDQDYVVEAFADFAESLGIDADLDRRFDLVGASFIPAFGPAAQMEQLADFSYLRVVRRMPKIRSLLPVSSPTRNVSAQSLSLPSEGPVDPNIRVAIFDGGLPIGSSLAPWAESFEFGDMGPPIPECEEHGQHVTSALLFGSIDPAKPLPRPHTFVDHYRVLDEDSGSDVVADLYDVLRRIEVVLMQDTYEFVSLSLGPDIPIEDDEIHVWTSFLDTYLADGQTLATIAVGNNGHLDGDAGLARIQVPADCVNGIAIGAASSQHDTWDRAFYSARGPGRSPGLVKPDALSFGGVPSEPFLFVAADKTVSGDIGTSFGGPNTMRTALHLRTMFGPRMTPMVLRSLLLHTAEPHTSLGLDECGRGRIQQDPFAIVTCKEGEARVIYQGELTPAKYLRATLPVPHDLPGGMVNLRATLAFATDVDPQDPSSYTRAGVDVVFRPHADKFDSNESQHAKTRSFFGQKSFESEEDLRADAHKWETLLHDSTDMRASSLKRPVFDLHYNAREYGHKTSRAPKIRYAMVITVQMKNCPNLYERVLHAYAPDLEAMALVRAPVSVEL